jgi:serine/threonine-protein kinase PknG
MSAVACTQPGCGGTIEDGYCTVCGLAPVSAFTPPSAGSGPGGGVPGGTVPRGGVPGAGIPRAAFESPNAGIRWADSGVAARASRRGGSGPAGYGPAGSGSGSGAAGSGSAGYGSASSVSSGGSVGTGTRSGSRGSRSGSGGRSSRGRLGAGLVAVPPVPAADPATAVLANPQVPENRRFCGNCGQLVGQSRDGRPGMTEGFCPHCRARFSFSPKLAPGDLVAGQYEVLGCLAHGGLGWIYLARDHNVSDRWVVLKGLLNSGDPDAMEAALAERRFLAEVEHPNIVRIYNFVQHTSRDGETAGYIVMEYVGGKSLKQIRLEARQRGTAVPLPHALAYALEILPALGYLHDHGLVYCDFKPDNVIQTEEQLKLIDMGGVRYIDDDGAIYGTVGYQAPEIETEGPSPSSDLYTVGRALAVLTFDFAGFQGQYKFRLPESEPLLARQESYARLLRRATHSDPARRFQSAGEMSEQLTGVLREVLSAADGEQRPAFSGLFSPELRAIGTDLTPVRPNPGPANGGAANGGAPNGGSANGGSANGGSANAGSAAAGNGPRSGSGTLITPPPIAEVIAGLPAPLADGTDPAAGYLATLAGLEPRQQADALLGAVGGQAGIPPAVAASPETRLALIRALIAAGDVAGATARLAEMSAADPSDWRIAWYAGLCELASSRPERALAAFSAVYDELPGELAPKLAIAFAAEAAGDPATARHYFELVWVIDRSYVSAAFGAARACLDRGDRVAAIAAVAAVPETSSHHAAAQIAAVRLLVAGGDAVSATDLRQADTRLGRLSLDDLRRQQLGVEILRAALDWVGSVPPAAGRGRAQQASERILGCEPNERALRFGLERGYRALASLVPDPARRIELVDMANSVRPRTWI